MSTARTHHDHDDAAASTDALHGPAAGKRSRTESLASGGTARPADGGALMSAPVQMKADPFDFSFVQKKGPDSSTATAAAAPADPFPTEKHAKASSFAALISLIELAEARLNAAGQDTDGVIHMLRGIFYGTKWSMDNDVESSGMRNTAFQIYTAQTAPDDPRPIIGKSLFTALKASAEVKDPSGKHNDVGHMLIGLDSRSWTASKVHIPSQGGTGQAINTWLGDLGGGAGMLAMKRGLDGKSTKKAIDHFTGSDYGGVVNLEGDIAGVVGVQIAPGQKLADALRAYLLPPKEDTTARWNHRAQLMLGEEEEHEGPPRRRQREQAVLVEEDHERRGRDLRAGGDDHVAHAHREAGQGVGARVALDRAIVPARLRPLALERDGDEEDRDRDVDEDRHGGYFSSALRGVRANSRRARRSRNARCATSRSGSGQKRPTAAPCIA